MKSKLVLVFAIVALVVAFFALNMLAGPALARARVDLTKDKLYTLTRGSRTIAASVDSSEPITLRYYFSSKAAQGNPGVQAFAQRVRELLDEYVLASKGGIKLIAINPEPSSEEEDNARADGITPIQIGPGLTLFLGLVGTNSVNGREVIPFLSPDPAKERFLEYDITKMIYSLANPKKKTVGVLTALPVNGIPFDMRTRQPVQPRPWLIINELKGLFDVKDVETTATEIPADVEVLMVIHPKGLSDQTMYAIDQFVLNGGRLIAFVDALCDYDPAGAGDQMGGINADKASNFDAILNAWGLEIPKDKIAGDNEYAIQVGGQGSQPVPYLPWIGVPKEGLTRDDAVTGLLGRVNVISPGVIQRKGTTPANAAPGEPAPPPSAADSSVELTPLIRTSRKAALLDGFMVKLSQRDPNMLRNGFKPTDTEYTLAARVGGKAKSAFPGGRPPRSPDDDAGSEPSKPHLAESVGTINAIIVADADMLTDMFWAREQTFGQISLGFTKIADNGDFVVNAVDSLMGSTDLMSVRARGDYTKPFTRVEKMEKATAEAQQKELEELNLKLQEAERRIGELQRQRGDSSSQAMILTPEQRAEIKKFEDQRLATRKQIRKKEFELRKDTEALATRLKIINIGLVPVLVSAAAVGLGAFRLSRRGSSRKKVAAAE